jgi:hypothetical protein
VRFYPDFLGGETTGDVLNEFYCNKHVYGLSLQHKGSPSHVHAVTKNH